MTDTSSTDIVVGFTPLKKGSIKDIFSPKRDNSQGRKAHDPMGLPTIVGQCVHVTYVQHVDENFSVERCTRDIISGGNHGWLCENHYAQEQQTDVVRPPSAPRNRDLEIAQSIIQTDARAIARMRG